MPHTRCGHRLPERFDDRTSLQGTVKYVKLFRTAAITLLAGAQVFLITAVIGPNWTWHLSGVARGPAPVSGFLVEGLFAAIVIGIVCIQFVAVMRWRRNGLIVAMLGLIALVGVGFTEAVLGGF